MAKLTPKDQRLLLQMFNTLLRGGDVRDFVKTKAFRAVYKKIQPNPKQMN